VIIPRKGSAGPAQPTRESPVSRADIAARFAALEPTQRMPRAKQPTSTETVPAKAQAVTKTPEAPELTKASVASVASPAQDLPDVAHAPALTEAQAASPLQEAPEADCARDDLLGSVDFQVPDAWHQEDLAACKAALASPTRRTPSGAHQVHTASQKTRSKASSAPLPAPTAVHLAHRAPDTDGPPLPPRQAKFTERYCRVTTYLEPAIQARMLALRETGRIQSLTQLTNAALKSYLNTHYPNG